MNKPTSLVEARRQFSTQEACEEYLAARRGVHVNRVENAWGLFKRGLMGVYHHVNAKYLQEYLDEFAFRQSNLKEKEALVSLVLASC
jgi:hypothetical protein